MIAQYALNMATAVEIEDIIYDVDDYVVFREVWYSELQGVIKSRKIRSKVRYGERPYFMHSGRRIYLDECERRGA